MAIGPITRFLKGALARAAQVTSRGHDPIIQDTEPQGPPRTALGPAIPTHHLDTTSHHQLQSTFFGKLPLEIRRQIYQELWASSGLDQHIYQKGGRFSHCPCTIDHDEPDERDELVELYRLEKDITDCDSFKNSALHQKLSSPWTKHWKCEEHLSQNGAPLNPFLLSLVSCKRM
jgi:hypothetical protein